MERFLTDALVISIGLLLIFSLDKIINLFEKYKLDKELKIRQSDSTLAKYFSEMTNDRNDGWTKLHYNQLYYKRLKQIKNGKA